MTDFFGANVEYNLEIANNTKKYSENLEKLEGQQCYDKITIKNNFQGIFLNQDFEDVSNFQVPKSEIHCKSGEKIDLALRLGGYKNADNYLAWINIGYSQYLINDKDKYLFFKIPNSELVYKKISIQAPIPKGKYEI